MKNQPNRYNLSNMSQKERVKFIRKHNRKNAIARFPKRLAVATSILFNPSKNLLIWVETRTGVREFVSINTKDPFVVFSIAEGIETADGHLMKIVSEVLNDDEFDTVWEELRDRGNDEAILLLNRTVKRVKDRAKETKKNRTR